MFHGNHGNQVGLDCLFHITVHLLPACLKRDYAWHFFGFKIMEFLFILIVV
jgi:hypothetical protein